MKLSAILSFGLLAFAAAQVPANAQDTCGPRVRRNWNALSDTDKATYKGALASAMNSGAYIKFVEIHHERMSSTEAHGQCMFIYWHRYFLVAFENILRAQGSEFACVTLPYFNWVEANSLQMDGKCSSLGDCANITSELGGFTSGSTRKVSITGDDVTGTCVDEWPLNHFCQSSTPGTDCSGCVPRGNWGSTSVPPETGLAEVRSQVFSKKGLDLTSANIEDNSHASVHNALGGAMSYLSSPADPIFWSHHSMVDALHTIFYKCRAGTQRMTFEEKASNPEAWASCNRLVGGKPIGTPFNPTDIVTVRTGSSSNSVNASEDSVVSQFFQGVPNQFADLMDVRDLGDFSYSYKLSGQLASMYTGCDGISTPTTSAPVATTSAPSPTTSASEPTTTAPAAATNVPEATSSSTPEPSTATPAPTTASPSAMDSPSVPQATMLPSTDVSFNNQRMEDARRFFEWLWNNMFPNNTRSFRKLAVDGELNDNDATTKQKGDSVAPAPSKGVPDDGKVDVIIIDECGESEQRVLAWYQQTTTAMGGMTDETIADLERQSCMYHDQCLGCVTDFSDEFKTIWGVKEARCKTIVDAVKCGAQPIVYSQWRETMEAHFGCPTPANSATPAPSNQDQTIQTNQQQTDTVQSISGAISQGTQSV